MLTVKHPKDKHFNDCEDCHTAEIYQCYCYLQKEDAESSADFFKLRNLTMEYLNFG
ncbi:MAG: hypothetical protein HDT39_09915 [Lachnospiraceae bacterium]|nr:hypothetical protein [Lachnospiraceae bacterium]